MNKEIKAKWLAALRNGAYKQTTKHLRDDTGFCCLGVLCDVIDPSKWTPEGSYENSKQLPPESIVKLAELSYKNPTVEIKKQRGTTLRELAALNDNGYTFLQIADLIEQQL